MTCWRTFSAKEMDKSWTVKSRRLRECGVQQNEESGRQKVKGVKEMYSVERVK